MDAQFDDATSSIILIGPSDDVVAVEKCVQSKYVEAVCSEKLDLQLPGIVINQLFLPSLMLVNCFSVLCVACNVIGRQFFAWRSWLSEYFLVACVCVCLLTPHLPFPFVQFLV